MSAISKAFAKALVKKYKLTVWDESLRQNQEYNSAFVEYDKKALLALIENLGREATSVRIYFGKYPNSSSNLETILSRKEYYRTAIPDAEIKAAKVEYKFVEENVYNNLNTLVLIGVDENRNEIFTDNGNPKIFTVSNILAENHGELCPPRPSPSDENSLYNETLYPTT